MLGVVMLCNDLFLFIMRDDDVLLFVFAVRTQHFLDGGMHVVV